MVAYVFLPKLPEELALCVAKYDGTKLEHKTKLTKCFKGIHDVAKYDVRVEMPGDIDADRLALNSLTIWEVTDLVVSLLVMRRVLWDDQPFGILLHWDELPIDWYVTIIDKYNAEDEVGPQYFKVLTRMIGGLKNLDSTFIRTAYDNGLRRDMVNMLPDWVFGEDDIDEELRKWKKFLMYSKVFEIDDRIPFPITYWSDDDEDI